ESCGSDHYSFCLRRIVGRESRGCGHLDPKGGRGSPISVVPPGGAAQDPHPDRALARAVHLRVPALQSCLCRSWFSLLERAVWERRQSLPHTQFTAHLKVLAGACSWSLPIQHIRLAMCFKGSWAILLRKFQPKREAS